MPVLVFSHYRHIVSYRVLSRYPLHPPRLQTYSHRSSHGK